MMPLRSTLLAALVALTAACYQAPGLTGPYRCNTDGTCGGGLVCDDGICCQPLGTPMCPTLVLDGGLCASGATPETWFLDKDGDGYGDTNSERLACAKPVSVPDGAPNAKWIQQGGDCNDNEPGIKPGAAETCDDVDNDCDGETDELFVKQTYYADKDKDGFGQKDGQGFVLCAPQGDYTSTAATDCDDAAPGVNPDAAEVCNGVDDDCDGTKDNNLTDTGASCASGLPGVCAVGTEVCSGGKIVCDANVKPGARTETCNGRDDDCDNEVDEGLTGVVCLLAPSEATQRSENSGVRTGGANQGCLGGRTGSSQTGFASPFWYADGGGNTQVFYSKLGSPSAKWNVTTRTLDVAFVAELDDASGIWSAWKQPAVYLCATDGTYARYIHTSDTNWNAKPTKITVNESIPLNLAQWAVGNGWTQTQATPPLDRINRIEIHLESATPTGGTASPFRVTWNKFQLR